MADTYTSGIWFVKPGEEDAFVEAWAEFVTTGREAPGSSEFRLARDLDVPGRYLSFAAWETFDAQKAWREQPEMQARFQRAQSHCQDFQSSTYELVRIV